MATRCILLENGNPHGAGIVASINTRRRRLCPSSTRLWPTLAALRRQRKEEKKKKSRPPIRFKVRRRRWRLGDDRTTRPEVGGQGRRRRAGRSLSATILRPTVDDQYISVHIDVDRSRTSANTVIASHPQSFRKLTCPPSPPSSCWSVATIT